MNLSSPLVRYRLVLGIFIVGLVASGVTAFPLLWELNLLARIAGVANVSPANAHGLGLWILTVRNGLADTYAHYPWIAYGTDWLAFGHITIAMFFVGPLVNPASARGVLRTGLVACCGVIPLALICGPIREIPIYWRFIDCSFGIFGSLPLLYCLQQLPLIDRK
jgi:hypothetical protein